MIRFRLFRRMSNSRYKAIVAKLRADGFESAYLDRLEERISAEEEETRLEVEVRAEIAAALGRTGAKVDMAFLELEVAKKALEAAPPGPEREALGERYQACRSAAEATRLDLRIHREAIGIRRNRDIDRMYPLPPPWRPGH